MILIRNSTRYLLNNKLYSFNPFEFDKSEMNLMMAKNGNLAELYVMQDNISDYMKDGKITENNYVSITKSNVYLPSEPIVPSRRTSPGNARNVAIMLYLEA